MGSARRAPGRAAARLGGATTAMRACLWLGVLVATAHGASPPRSRPRLLAPRRSWERLRDRGARRFARPAALPPLLAVASCHPPRPPPPTVPVCPGGLPQPVSVLR